MKLKTRDDTGNVLVPKRVLLHNRIAANGLVALHVHRCGHECDSSYCEDPKDYDCENCGGPEHILKGREPWRGR